MKKGNLKIPKILFYAGTSYGFRSLTIWHLFEICRVYPTILLSEKLDPETETVLKNKKFFPKLKKIVILKHSRKLIIKNNKFLYQEAKEVINKYKPDIVITPGKNVYPLELYLRRIAKKRGIINICFLGPWLAEAEEVALWIKLVSACSQEPKFLPLCFRILLTKLKRELGHFLYYWILPLMVRELPFRKESGCVLSKRNLGKSADYYIVFSKNDYNLSLKEGMPAEKLYILTEPYPSEYKKIREFLKRRFIIDKSDNEVKKERKILTLMWPETKIGIKREGFGIISEEEMEKKRIKIIALITKILRGWKIFIKPHPFTQDLAAIKKILEPIFTNLKIVDHLESAEKYTEISNLIIGFPPASVTLYTASLICPEKAILALDLEKELLGDCYKNFKGIEYLDSEEKLVNILKLIKNNKYYKNYKSQKKEKLEEKEFSNIPALLEYLFNKK